MCVSVCVYANEKETDHGSLRCWNFVYIRHDRLPISVVSKQCEYVKGNHTTQPAARTRWNVYHHFLVLVCVGGASETITSCWWSSSSTRSSHIFCSWIQGIVCQSGLGKRLIYSTHLAAWSVGQRCPFDRRSLCPWWEAWCPFFVVQCQTFRIRLLVRLYSSWCCCYCCKLIRTCPINCTH